MYRYNVSNNRIELRTHRSYLLSAFLAIVERVAVWQDRRRQRLTLARLDDRMLRDIGLSASDVEAEIAKPFWR